VEEVGQEQARPLLPLAPVAGLDVNELVDGLAAEGLVDAAPGMSVQQLAERHDAEAGDILVSVFRRESAQ